MELNEALMHSDSAQASELCAELQGTDIVMQNIKAMNTYLIKAVDYHFSNSDSSAINAIAYQKVQKGGPAVVTARNWLGIYLIDSELQSIPKNSNNDGFKNNWQVQLYPNPSEGLLNIESNINENLKVIVFNSQGKMVAETNNLYSDKTFDFKNLTNGVYDIQILLENGNQKNLKWVVTK
jgi:Secretion system C-terminal sorting domain